MLKLLCGIALAATVADLSGAQTAVASKQSSPSASSSKWGAGSVLRAVFGFEQDAEAAGSRQRAHFDELFEAARAARASPALSADAGRVFRSSRHHVLCSDVRSKSRTESSLAGLSPSVPYHPIFTSSQRDMVCYMSIMDGVTASSLPVDVFRAVVPVEAFLRLHPSVVETLQQMISAKSIGSHPMMLDATRGLGVRRLGISEHKSSREIAETVRQRLHSDAHAWALNFARINGASDESQEDSEAESSSSAGSWLHHLRSMASFVRSSQSSGQRVSDVCGFSSIRFSDLPRGVRVHGVEVLHRPECVLLLAAHLAVSSDDVAMVSISQQPMPSNDFARPLTQVGVEGLSGDLGNLTVAPGSTPYTAAGLTGKNQVIAVGDTGLDELMCFFAQGDGTVVQRSTIENPYTDPTRRKVIQYIAYQDEYDKFGGHGTHVCGSVAAQVNDPNNPQHIYDGMAFESKIAFFDLTPTGDPYIYPPSDMYNDFYAVSATSGAKISTNSWGSGSNYYDTMALDTDEYLYDHPEFLVLFAAGNSGLEGYGSVGSPSVGKNMVTVGATETGHNTTNTPNSNPQNMAYFSGIGPTYDGRIKPDLCAPGLYIYSALAPDRTDIGDQETCDITAKAGTSMATPVTASNSALVRQYFTDPAFWQAECSRYASAASCAAFAPSGTLVKAILIGSGDPMNAYITRGKAATVPYTELGPPPDYFQGYGRVQLDNILPLHSATPSDQRLYVEDQVEVTESTERVYKVTVTNAAVPFRFGVSWYDPPNMFYSSKVLLNDLDLIVTSPSGVVYYGNNIKGDELNNNERVVIDTPEVGVYTVRVQGKVFGTGACSASSSLLCQKVSIVAVSSGTVTLDEVRDVDPLDYVPSDERADCEAEGGELFYVSIQGLEDGSFGESNLTVSSATFSETMSPWTVSEDYVNPWYPATTAMCLVDGQYTLSLYDDGTVGGNIASCGAYVSLGQNTFDFEVKDGKCSCANGWTTVEMTAYTSESWLDYYYYEIKYVDTPQVNQTRFEWRGSLIVGNKENLRLCLPYGKYDVALRTIDDVAITDSGVGLIISACDLNLNMAQPTGACFLTDAVDPSDTDSSDSNQWALDGSMNAAMITLIVVLVLAVAGVAVAVAVRFSKRRRGGGGDLKNNLLDHY